MQNTEISSKDSVNWSTFSSTLEGTRQFPEIESKDPRGRSYACRMSTLPIFAFPGGSTGMHGQHSQKGSHIVRSSSSFQAMAVV